jgi:hypothetical protein
MALVYLAPNRTPMQTGGVLDVLDLSAGTPREEFDFLGSLA